MKRHIPHFNPSCTLFEWSPTKQASRVISRHQKKEKSKITKIEKLIGMKTAVLKNNTNDVIKAKTLTPLSNGQGLCDTIWKEWKFISIKTSFLSNIRKVIYKKQKVVQLLLVAQG